MASLAARSARVLARNGSDRRSFSARGAGILGLSNLGRGHVYALHDDMSLNLDALQALAPAIAIPQQHRQADAGHAVAPQQVQAMA